jgi:hypothetical protein
MSYCHSIPPIPTQSRYTFGQAAEVSHHELDDYMLAPAGPPLNMNIVTAVGAFTISGITSASSVAPSSSGNAASITASPSAGATYLWSIQNGSIPGSTTTNSITFTAGAAGTVILRATAFGTNNCGVTDTKSVAISTYNPPTSVEAHATGINSAQVTWVAPLGGTAPGRYNVYRSGDGVNYTFAGFTAAPTVTFSDAVSTNKAYLYKVRSADVGNTIESADSNRDLATIVVYTNLPVTAGVSTIQAVDINQLRTAVDAVRSLYGIGLGAYTYTPITAGTSIVHALDISELRTNLNTALNGLGLLPLPVYTNGTINAGSSVIMAVDFNELRMAMY